MGDAATGRHEPGSVLSRSARPFDVVAIASSAGGLQALSRVLSALPAGFPAALVVVQHLDPRHRSLMSEILGRRTALPVKEAEARERLEPGTVYVAPPNAHLLVDPGGILALTHTELVHFVRPSADLLFESVAASYGSRAIAVVLTGTGSDGSMGVRGIRQMGGTVIAQDEASSDFYGMPGAAIQTGCVDFILSLEEIAPALLSLVTKERGKKRALSGLRARPAGKPTDRPKHPTPGRQTTPRKRSS